MERKILVTSESQLHVSVLTELRQCGQCGGTHQRMIVGTTPMPEDGKVYDRNFGLIDAGGKRAYFLVPNPCGKPGKPTDFAYAIAERRLYIVEIPLKEEENPYAVVKKKEDVS